MSFNCWFNIAHRYSYKGYAVIFTLLHIFDNYSYFADKDVTVNTKHNQLVKYDAML